MAKETRRARVWLLLLILSACAQGVDAIDPGPAGNVAGAAGAGTPGTAGADGSNTAGSAGTSSGDVGGAPGSAGSISAGSATVGGTANGGSASGGASAGSAGSAKAGSANGGSAAGGSSSTAGSANGGTAAGGTSSAGSAGSSAGSVGTAGSGGAPATPCSGKKPEANCTCQSYSSHDYWFCPTGRDFTSAEANCVSAGLHLAHVLSAAEDKWINDAANAASFGEYWLGSTDASTPNTWTWLAGGTFWTGVANGTATGYAHWNSGEPNASGDCLVVQTGFAWDDRICTDQRKYICD